jgi:hypothetical protein
VCFAFSELSSTSAEPAEIVLIHKLPDVFA